MANTLVPSSQCLQCVEKHFSTAVALMREVGYADANRMYILGELSAAQIHCNLILPVIAKDIYEIRTLIHQRREKEITTEKLEEIYAKIDEAIKKSLEG